MTAVGCSKGDIKQSSDTSAPVSETAITVDTSAPQQQENSLASRHVRNVDAPANGDIVILMTGDTHSWFNKGFTYAGVYEVRYQMELKGDTVILVDDGDAIQGSPAGLNDKGEMIIDFMNAMEYDVAIPGVHEFHYGMDRFFEIRKKAKFEYICSNFQKDGQPVLKPYVIKEVCGKKVAFVGVTTPKALTQLPLEYFQDETGKVVYDFLQDETGDAIVNAVQDSINKARAEGAQYVIVMGHIGKEALAEPWTYEFITTRLTGCDAYLDGYSHEIKTEEYIDATGVKRLRLSAGTAMRGLAWLRISSVDGEITGGVHQWQNKISPYELFDFENPISKMTEAAKKALGIE